MSEDKRKAFEEEQKLKESQKLKEIKTQQAEVQKLY